MEAPGRPSTWIRAIASPESGLWPSIYMFAFPTYRSARLQSLICVSRSQVHSDKYANPIPFLQKTLDESKKALLPLKEEMLGKLLPIS